jgi:hypothetical protein
MPNAAKHREDFLRRSGIGSGVRVRIESADPHGLRVAERGRKRRSQVETGDVFVGTDRPDAIV